MIFVKNEKKNLDEVIVRNGSQSPGENGEVPLDLSVPNTSTISNLAESTSLECRNQEKIDEIRLVDRAHHYEELSSGSTLQDQSNESQLFILASTSSQQIRSLNLPSKRRTVGRPKGSINNAIGLKRKKAPKTQNNKKVKVKATILAFHKRFLYFILSR